MRTLSNPQDRREIESRLERLSSETPARWGRMNAHQAVCHLSDSFKATIGERAVSPASMPFQRTIMKWGALWFPMPWPKGVPTRPEMEQGRGGTPPGEFERDLADLRASMGRFIDTVVTGPAGRRGAMRHPMFGSMSNAEWLRWGYLHTDHHLRQFGL